MEPFGQPIALLHDSPNLAKPEEAFDDVELPNSSSESSAAVQTMSLAELRHDMQNTRIPSSASPSPIKTPFSSNSPAKISREATRVLQDSITSLLGKRISSDDTDSGHSSKPKRPRPPSRMKVLGIHFPPLELGLNTIIFRRAIPRKQLHPLHARILHRAPHKAPSNIS